MSIKAAETYFTACVEEWHLADRECQRTFAIWNDACERRVRLAAKKNAAYEELEIARRTRKPRH